MTSICIQDRYEADDQSAPGVAAVLMAIRAGRFIESVSFMTAAMGHSRHDAAAITLVLGGYRREHTLTDRQRAGLFPFMNRLERSVTMEMALNDKAYLCIDMELVCQEAFAIDKVKCAHVLAESVCSRDLLRFEQNRRAMRTFLRALDACDPVLWLNAVNGVYRTRQNNLATVGV